MVGSEGGCVWIKSVGVCILIILREVQMDSQNEEAIKFFNVEEEEDNGHGAYGKKRFVEKKGDSLVKKSSWFESIVIIQGG